MKNQTFSYLNTCMNFDNFMEEFAEKQKKRRKVGVIPVDETFTCCMSTNLITESFAIEACNL